MIRFCTQCGQPVAQRIPDGDDRMRPVCTACGTIHYQNPRLVVGTIPEYQGRILLCRRDIEPQRGLWTLPAGYLENGESALDGAIRETWEEARCRLVDLSPYYLADLVEVNQLYLMFRGRLERPQFDTTAESSEVCLVAENDIPWDDLAFAVIRRTLSHYIADRRAGTFIFRNEATVTTRFHTRP